MKIKHIKYWSASDYGKNAIISLLLGLIVSMGKSAGYSLPSLILSLGDFISLVGLTLGTIWLFKKVKTSFFK